MDNNISLKKSEKTVDGIKEGILRALLNDERTPCPPKCPINTTTNELKQRCDAEENMDNNDSKTRSAKTMSDQQIRNLEYCFRQEMETYEPDYKKIAETNQYKQLSDADEDERKRQAFANGIRSIREIKHYTCEKMGKMLKVSKQRINEYELGNFKYIPVELIPKIKLFWGITPAYMLGMSNDMDSEPHLEQYYFWEHTENTPYEIFRDIVAKWPWHTSTGVPRNGPTGYDLYSLLVQSIGDDYELCIRLYYLFAGEDEAEKNRKINAIKAILKV